MTTRLRLVLIPLLLAVLGAALLGVLAFGLRNDPGHAPAIDQNGARRIATDLFMRSHGPGSLVANVMVLQVQMAADEATGRPVWKVNIQGDIKEPRALSVSYVSVFWISVDATSGDAVVLASG